MQTNEVVVVKILNLSPPSDLHELSNGQRSADRYFVLKHLPSTRRICHVADKSCDARITCCKQTWTLSVINYLWQSNYVDNTCNDRRLLIFRYTNSFVVGTFTAFQSWRSL